MKEQKLQEENAYRKHLIKIYNNAITNNLKIRNEIENVIEKLKMKVKK